MKTRLFAAFAATLIASASNAAGISKKLILTVDETKLHGFTATTSAQRYVAYAIASDASASEQRVAAIVMWEGALEQGVGLPPPSAITTISVTSGAILTKDFLPASAQLTEADCNSPTRTCPEMRLFAGARLDKSIPNRLLVDVLKSGFSGVHFTATSLTYLFDPAAAGVNRWTLIHKSPASADHPKFSVTPSETNLYTFVRDTEITTQIFQLSNK